MQVADAACARLFNTGSIFKFWEENEIHLKQKNRKKEKLLRKERKY